MIKVGFDISQVAHVGGVTTYTKNLAKFLSKDEELEMIFFYSSLRKPYLGNLSNVKSFKLPPTLFEILFNRMRNIPIENFLGKIDIFHSSDWVQPPTKAKKVTTYHDVVPLKFPEWSHPKIVSVAKRRLKLVEEEVDKVIVVSQSTKNDLSEVSKISEDKIVVIYEGVSKRFKVQDEKKIADFKKKLCLPEKYVLAIGGIGRRRNLEMVKKVTDGYNLVIAGETINRLSDEEMPFLYAGAQVLLYPSFYEGFGLPILEAMACGTPVITSSLSSMPEVGGDGVLYVNPKDEVDISNKLFDVVNNKKLREIMIKKGLVQAKRFSWEKCARETVRVYRSLTNS